MGLTALGIGSPDCLGRRVLRCLGTRILRCAVGADCGLEELRRCMAVRGMLMIVQDSSRITCVVHSCLVRRSGRSSNTPAWHLVSPGLLPRPVQPEDIRSEPRPGKGTKYYPHSYNHPTAPYPRIDTYLQAAQDAPLPPPHPQIHRPAFLHRPHRPLNHILLSHRPCHEDAGHVVPDRRIRLVRR